MVAHGDRSVGESVRKVLGVGKVTLDLSGTTVTDVVVIIGKDYVPPTGEDSKGEE